MDADDKLPAYIAPTPNRPTPPSPAIKDASAARERSPIARYLIAVGVTIVALGLTIVLRPWLTSSVFLMYWPAVFAAAWFGGFGPAVLASFLAAATVFSAAVPTPGLYESLPQKLVGFSGFLLGSILSSWAFSRVKQQRMAAAHAAEVNAELARLLDESATELAQQLEEAQAMQEEIEASTEELAERTEEAERAERFTRGILDSISDPFVVYDSDWRLRYINEAARRVFVLSPTPAGDLVGRNAWKAWPELEGSEIKRKMLEAARNRAPLSFEAFAQDSGTWYEIHCYPLPDSGLGAQWKDITARKRAGEATHYLSEASKVLASSLDYEKTLTEVAQLIVPHFADWCAVSILDPSGEPQQLSVAHVDPDKVEWAHELNRRYPPNHSLNSGVGHVIRTNQPELYPDIPDELLVATAVDEEHLRIMRGLGLKSAMVVPLSTLDKTVGAITIVSAESGRRYTEQDLEFAMELARRAAFAVDNAMHHKAELDARQVAEGANAAKTQFLAVMSHELRTPLNAIGGYAELILMGLRGPLTPDQRADLERIQRSQRNLLSLINDILNYAKLDAGRVEFAMTTVQLHPLLLELEPMVTPQLRARKLKYQYTGCNEALSVSADPEKVRQILLNLLSNAIKFTDAGGDIKIDCEGGEDSVTVTVTDTGSGIPEDKVATVFEPFVQLERKLSSNHEGTGLGLAISRDLARGMGGDLSVESRVGDGSVFRLTLPKEGSSACESQQPQGTQTPEGSDRGR